MSKNGKTFILICSVIAILSGRVYELVTLFTIYFIGRMLLAALENYLNKRKAELTVEPEN